jgi:hypothetical protein
MGKSFADKVRETASNSHPQNILSRIERIKKNSKESLVEDSPILEIRDNQIEEQTSEQTSRRTNEQASEHTPMHVPEHMSEQTNKRTNEQTPFFDNSLCPPDLRLNQFQVLNYIYFNRPFSVRGLTHILNIKYGTVRNILGSLTRKNYIEKPFRLNNGVANGSTCVVDEIKCIKLFGPSNIEQTNIRTYEHTSVPNKLVSKYLNKLTNYIENSDFWKKESLSEKKCEQWLEEFKFLKNDPDLLITQLMFAENTNSVLEPKTKTPVHVFYGCLKNGGLTRPKTFLFPDEKALKIRQQELKIKEKLLADQAAIREKEIKIADELAFNEFMENKENVESLISEIEKTFVTPKKKNSIKIFRKGGQIDSTLYNALKNEFGKTED